MAAAQPPVQGIAPPKKPQTKENIAENWKTFKQVWTKYRITTNLDKQSKQYRVALFLHCIGTPKDSLWNVFQRRRARENGSKVGGLQSGKLTKLMRDKYSTPETKKRTRV